MHTLQQLRSGELKGITRLSLSCGLTEFPDEIFSLADSLGILDLSNNHLSQLPKDLGRLQKLRIIFLSDNQFTELPTVLKDCPLLDMIGFKSNQIGHVPEEALPLNTRWLILTNNRISALPRSIGNCHRLQKVALAGNALTRLPAEMANCRNLELLRISANQFTALPEWLLKLPKLAWLAFAGNPFSNTHQTLHTPEQWSWNELELLGQLGEGASGNIYKAHHRHLAQDIAVKVFKGEVTSDGFPADEMQACIAAGDHASLTQVLGEITGHPQQKQGLVLSLIPPSYYNLGLPPSLATCSRDTFAQGTQFHAAEILKIAKAIASATAHLHARHINHGDLYAHNILINEQAHALMGDFGAASFYDPESPDAPDLQRIEVRAFGCLLDDLLQNLAPEDASLAVTQQLQSLRTACMLEDVEKRPLFAEIGKALA